MLLLLCTVGLLGIGAKFGYAINIITIGPVILGGVGGSLALLAVANSSQADLRVSVASNPRGESLRDNSSEQSGTFDRAQGVYQYDRAKWHALVEFDPDIARLEETLRPFGQKYVDQLAAGYLVLNDKNYLPNIVQKIIETARQDSAKTKAEEERWGRRFSDPIFLQQYANEKADFLMRAPFGNVIVLKKGPVLLEREGQITTYTEVSELRAAAQDFGAWPEITDAQMRVRLIS